MDDSISRQEAFDAIFSEPLYESGMKKKDAEEVVPAIFEKIKSLPPTKSDDKQGEWLWSFDCDGEYWICSACMTEYECDEETFDTFVDWAKFCPSCGAKMSCNVKRF